MTKYRIVPGKGVTPGMTKLLEQANEADDLRTQLAAAEERARKAEAELRRYSMSAGHADQRRCESRAAREALGFEPDSDHVAPADLTEAIAKLKAERDEARALGLGIKEMADRCDAELTRQLASERQARERAEAAHAKVIDWLRESHAQAASLRAALETARDAYREWATVHADVNTVIDAALSPDSGAALLGFARAAYAMAHELNDGEGPHWEDARDVVALAPCWLVDRVKP